MIKVRYSRSAYGQSRVTVWSTGDDWHTDGAALCRLLENRVYARASDYRKRLRGSGIERICRELLAQGVQLSAELSERIRRCRDEGEARAAARVGVPKVGLDDPAVRGAVVRLLLRQDARIRVHTVTYDAVDEDEPVLLHEVVLNNARADIAVVTPERLDVYEVKSDRDSLIRLRRQSIAYDAVADTSTLCTTDRYLERGLATVPEHWGVILVRVDSTGAPQATWHRQPEQNQKLDTHRMLTLLWAEEIRNLAAAHAPIRGAGRMTKRELIRCVTANVPADDITSEVRYMTSCRWRHYHGRW